MRENEADALTIDAWERWFKQAGEREARQILFWRWDPIGVSDAFPFAVDEYDSFIPALLSLLRMGSSAAEVADHLAQIERDDLGLRASKRQLRKVADLIVTWYGQSISRWKEFQGS